tara:strand:- start:2013 stop:2228 length:216 start_codon:yes stop_codon:yes gene_type:complete
MEKFEVGDLVKDALNEGGGTYGLGIVVGINADFTEEDEAYHPEKFPPLKYNVYFTEFERIITFHGDYLEKV